MNSVLFVCLGNICRSPLAEGIFRHLTETQATKKTYQIDSCGTGAWHVGSAPHEGSRKIAAQNGISLDGIRARQVDDGDFFNFQLIVAMDQSNLSDLREINPNPESNIVLLRQYDPIQDSLDVPDPYYAGGFDKVYEIIHRSCETLLQSLEGSASF